MWPNCCGWTYGTSSIRGTIVLAREFVSDDRMAGIGFMLAYSIIKLVHSMARGDTKSLMIYDMILSCQYDIKLPMQIGAEDTFAINMN